MSGGVHKWVILINGERVLRGTFGVGGEGMANVTMGYGNGVPYTTILIETRRLRAKVF